VRALDILQQGKRLAERAERVLDAGFPVRLRRRILCLEKGADGLRNVLGDPENFLRNVGVLL
jgi:hypothetical protein